MGTGLRWNGVVWLYMFCIIAEDRNGWLSQEVGVGLRCKGSRVAVYVLY